MFNELTAKQTVFHYILCDESLRFNKTALISQRHDYYCCATVPVAFHYTKGRQSASKVARPCLLQACFVFDVFLHFVRRSELTPFIIMISFQT